MARREQIWHATIGQGAWAHHRYATATDATQTYIIARACVPQAHVYHYTWHQMHIKSRSHAHIRSTDHASPVLAAWLMCSNAS